MFLAEVLDSQVVSIPGMSNASFNSLVDCSVYLVFGLGYLHNLSCWTVCH